MFFPTFESETGTTGKSPETSPGDSLAPIPSRSVGQRDKVPPVGVSKWGYAKVSRKWGEGQETSGPQEERGERSRCLDNKVGKNQKHRPNKSRSTRVKENK